MRHTVLPARALRGEVRVPGDKSIAHRALMLAAIAAGESRVAGLPDGEDVRSTGAILAQLGVRQERDEAGATVVHGVGVRGLGDASAALDCGNSGTSMRLLAGLLAGHGVQCVLTGDASLRRRPMRRVVEPLRAMGARVGAAADDLPPLRLEGGSIRAVTYRTPVPSAQIKSCVLLAGLYGDGPTTVVEQYSSRDHTERLLRRMGARIEVEGREPSAVTVWPQASLEPLNGTVPGDVSSAAYWLVAASLGSGSDMLLPNVGDNPTRFAVVDLLRTWGARVERLEESMQLGEPVALLRVRSAPGRLLGGTILAHQVPGLIDELPLLAALGALTDRGVEIRGAAELRVKESDRIAATCEALRALGVEVEEYPDGMAVAGRQRLVGGVVEACGDHRLAMAFGALGLASEDGITIEGSEVAAVSYPGFFEQVELLATR